MKHSAVKEICAAAVYSITAELETLERLETSIEAVKADKRYKAAGREKRLEMLEQSKAAHEKCIAYALTNAASMLETCLCRPTKGANNV